MDQLVCLIVGDTPSTQLLSWRLSLSNCFIILVSSSLSSDGLISWKSTKLGSNFYKPNVTCKDLDSLKKSLNVRKVDIIIISSHSITQYMNQLKSLGSFVHDEVVIIIDSNFGVELELFSLLKFPNVITLSVLVDAEVRRLSIGSYLLINDSNSFMFGVSYDSSNSRDKVLVDNVEHVTQYLQKSESSFKSMLELLDRTNVGTIEVVCPKTGNFGLLVWEGLIPRISLNILSIVFEQVSYDELLKSESNAKVFRHLVRELLEICYKQTNGKVPEYYVLNNDIHNPDYNAVLLKLKHKQRELEKFAKSEYPEYLTLNYEAYCFYHRIEFPSALMFKQCIDIAEKYSCNNSNLTFLSGFYARLLSLSGIQMENDTNDLKTPNLLWGKKNLLNVNKELTGVRAPPKEKKKPKKQKKTPIKRRSNKVNDIASMNGYKSPELQLPRDLQEMYLGCDSMNFSSPVSPKVLEMEFVSTSEDILADTSYEDESEDLDSNHSFREDSMPNKSLVRVASGSNLQEDDNLDASISLPLFKGFKNAAQRPMTTGRLEMTDLEWQLRNGYSQLPKQLILASKKELANNGSIRQHSVVGQYWKLIKQQHINNGQLVRPLTSQEDVLRFHCDTLEKSHVHLSTTTNRYGDLDLSDNVHENAKQRRGNLYKQIAER